MARAVKPEPAAPEGRAEGKSLRTFLLLAALLIGALIFLRQRSGPDPGTPARDFTLPVVAGEGQAFQLSAHRGSPVLIEVFASWCQACKRAAPLLRDAARAKRKSEVQFVGVSVDAELRDAEDIARSWGIPYPVLHDDGSFAKSYEIDVLPTFVLVDATGKVTHASSGAPSEAELERWLSDLGAARL